MKMISTLVVCWLLGTDVVILISVMNFVDENFVRRDSDDSYYGWQQAKA